MKKVCFLFTWTGLFAVAMAFIESAVVVYLREIYYPDGFAFPLKTIEGVIAVTEIFREAATMIMLAAVAVISARQALQRFAVFIYVFAVWDIFYYIFLYLLLGWPPSLLTWDILFLIPVTWVGPVLAPVINSLTMILVAFLIVYKKSGNELFRLKFLDWFLLVTGSLITIAAYTNPYLRYMLASYSFFELFNPDPPAGYTEYASRFIPGHFNWVLFTLGEVLFLVAVILMYFRGHKTRA